MKLRVAHNSNNNINNEVEKMIDKVKRRKGAGDLELEERQVGASSGCGGRCRGFGAPFCVAKLAELGGDVPDGEAGMGIEDGINIPGLQGGNGDEGLVTSLPPGPHVLPPLLETSPQCIGCLLVKAMQCVAVDVVPHFRLVDVARPCLLRISKYLIRYLH